MPPRDSGRNRRGAIRPIVAIIACIVCASKARAESRWSDEPRTSCAAEIARWHGEQEDGPALLGLLMDHPHELSTRCVGGIVTTTVRTWAWRRPCTSDLQRFCTTFREQTDEECAIACLEEHDASLSPQCRSRFAALPDWTRRFRAAAEKLHDETGIVAR